MMFNELAPSGTLRIAVAVGPTKSAVWTMIPEGKSEPEGVTVDLAHRIGALTGLPVDMIKLSSSAHIIDTADHDIWDLSFTPVDDHRRRLVDFGAAFHVGESSYLVRRDSAFKTAADLHRSGLRLLAVSGTATLRTAERVANGAEVVAVDDLSDACARFAAGEGDAIALSRLALNDLVTKIAHTRIVEGNFHEAETAIAVPKGRPEALAAADRLIRQMKADGTVAASFARHGMADAVIPD